ncbi:MAG: leucine-rich repeat domain-containing protein [Saprospiraceae bacterium]|nr:leucine-rich repeat domain-containing protein [Saprospiraceae bacterium]
METPATITKLESLLGRPLHPAPTHGYDPVRNAMACRNDPQREGGWMPQYALHPDGTLGGLHLGGLDLDDQQWQQIAAGLPLDRLEALNLRKNKLTNLPDLEKMPNLRYLDLCDNQLTEFALPDGLADQLEHLWLQGNEALTTPPPEVVRQGRFALHNYFREIAEQGAEVVYEAKMLILGDAGAGKTTLARKVENPDAAPPDAVKDSTPGIVVTKLQLTDAAPAFTMHLWDFGGQEVYHATHRFFLTKKSLYVLLCDGRKEEQFDYWLQMQEIYGQDSRLLLVVNQKGDMQPVLPMSDLRRDYPNVQEGRPTVVNLVADREGAVALRRHIERSIRSLPQFERGEQVPKKWVVIRHRLEAIDADHIPLGEFRKICNQEGIKEKERQDFLLDFLHDLGAFLHFRDVAGLNKMVILRPEWATQAVYSVLDHTRKKGDNGHFTRADLDAVWHCAEYEEYFEELLLLMEKFELCYRAPEQEGLYIVPSLLPDDPPEGYAWGASTVLQLHYQYTFMPKDIIARLIVRQHHLLESPPVMWKRGAVFGENGARVEVVESYRDKRISLRSDSGGRAAKELLGIIARDIDAINRGFHFNERMRVEQKIPCHCAVCKELPVPHYFSRSNLDRAERAGQPVQCQEGFYMVNVRELLDGVFANELGGKTAPLDRELLLGWIEDGDLLKAFEAMKSAYPDASNHISSLRDIEKAYREERISFEELRKGKARLRHAALSLLGK